MNTTDDQSDTCAECGAPVTSEPHACSTPETTPPDDTTTRISIPDNLWSTGLFKPAWNRDLVAEDERPADAPRQVVTGSLLARPDDLADPDLPPETDIHSDNESDTDEVADTADVTEDTSPDPSPASEAAEIVEDPAPAPQMSDTLGGIDAAFVVPSSLLTAPVSVDDEIAPEEPEPLPTEAIALSPIAIAEESARQADEDVPNESPDEDPDDMLEDTPLDGNAAEGEEPLSDHALSAFMRDDTGADFAPLDPESLDPESLDPAPLASSPFTPPPLTQEEISQSVAAPTTVQPSAIAHDTAETPPRPRRKAWIILLVLVLIAALAVGGWLWWQRGQDEPIRDAFVESNAAFIEASQALTDAENIDEVAAAADKFSSASDLLAESRDLAEGRPSDLSNSVRRATGVQLQVSESAEKLTDLGADDFGVWGEIRGSLRLGLGQLSGVEKDIVEAGGSTDGLPTTALISSTDALVVESALTTAELGTDRIVKDLTGAKQIKALRASGERAATGATVLTGAVDSLADTEVDTELLSAHLGVQNATAKLTRLQPNSLNQWKPIRTKIQSAASALPDPQALTKALASANSMVTDASDTWDEWKRLTETARTQQQDDLATVRAARAAITDVLTNFESQDASLAAVLARGDSLRGEGTEGQAFRTLDAAATARTALSAEVGALGTPDEVSEEIAEIRAALDANATSIRAAADAAAACVDDCKVTETAEWRALVEARSSQASDVSSAVDAWKDAVPAALKEIRKRELPKRPRI